MISRLAQIALDLAHVAGAWRYHADRAFRELAHVPRWAILVTAQGERFAGLVALCPAGWEVQIAGDRERAIWIPAFRVVRLELCEAERAIHVATSIDLRREAHEAARAAEARGTVRESDTRALRPVPPPPEDGR